MFVFTFVPSTRSSVRTNYTFAFVTDSIGARPKNARLLLHDALACLSAPRTDHYHFTGRRRWRTCVPTSTRAPALRAPRVSRAPSGYPAPYHAARHQLVPCSVKSVLLGFRAVQLACRFTLLCSCLSSRLCAIAFSSYSYLRNVLTHITVKNLTTSSSMQLLHLRHFPCCVGRSTELEYCTSGHLGAKTSCFGLIA